MLVQASGLLTSQQALTVQLASGLRWVECTVSDCKHTQTGFGKMLSAATEGTVTQKRTLTTIGHSAAGALSSYCTLRSGNDECSPRLAGSRCLLYQNRGWELHGGYSSWHSVSK